MPINDAILRLLQAGINGLAAYLAAHVLLCLLPAFFIAGAMTALIPKETITRFLGRDSSKWVSYPAAAIGGFVLAVCSCTIMPLFAGIYKKGAGIGPAMTFLFVGPAVNILAISFTGVQIGMDIALARLILALIFGTLIGLIMAWIFQKDDKAHQQETNGLFSQRAKLSSPTIALFILLMSILIVGTLQVNALSSSMLDIQIEAAWAPRLQEELTRLKMVNADGESEGVTVQGLMLIILLVFVAAAAWRGFSHADEGISAAALAALGLISFTVLAAALKIDATASGLSIGLTGRLAVETGLIAAAWLVGAAFIPAREIGNWLWETLRFMKQIIPLLLLGVFLAGVARALIPPAWVARVAGQNTLMANLAGVLFGVFAYFPTLVEVPVAQTFLSLGMHRGPLLAYLLADPELSLQSILITESVIGRKKTAMYVGLVVLFSTLSGYLFGLTLGS